MHKTQQTQHQKYFCAYQLVNNSKKYDMHKNMRTITCIHVCVLMISLMKQIVSFLSSHVEIIQTNYAISARLTI